MLRRFFRHIKEGFIGFGRNFSMAISSVISVTITLTLIGLFLTLVLNLNVLTMEIEESISLSALVSYDVTSESELNMIKGELEKIDGVSKVEYKSKDEEFTYYINQYPDLSEFYEGYRNDNPFHDAFMISADNGQSLDAIKQAAMKIGGIDSVHDGGSNTYLLVNAFAKIRTVGAVLVLALTFLATYLIYNTIRVTIQARETEIWIMRTVGARNGYIRAPLLVEGIIIGILGSIIPILVMVFGYYYLYDFSGGVLLGVLTMIKPMPYLVYLSLVLMTVGVLVGFVGSYFSVTKTLRKTR